jgi:pantothenate kinase
MKTIEIPTLFDLLTTRPKATRILVAIAGAPGSGKSTVAEALVAQLNQATPGRAAVLPMDGYHYDNMLLGQFGRLARKGAPDTFDVLGLRHMLIRLRDNVEDAVVVPGFDRDLEIARAGARLIPASVDIVVVEGNYLLLREPPWDALRPHFDLTVMVDVPERILRQRLTSRWQSYALPPEEIARKLEEVDLPNGRFVRNESTEADYRIDGGICASPVVATSGESP